MSLNLEARKKTFELIINFKNYIGNDYFDEQSNCMCVWGMLFNQVLDSSIKDNCSMFRYFDKLNFIDADVMIKKYYDYGENFAIDEILVNKEEYLNEVFGLTMQEAKDLQIENDSYAIDKIRDNLIKYIMKLALEGDSIAEEVLSAAGKI